MSTKLLAAAAFVAFMIGAPASAAVAPITPPSAPKNLVTNGSFEQGTDPGQFTTISPGNSTAITGWTVGPVGTTTPPGSTPGGSVDYIGSYWTAQNGSRSIDLAGSSPGTISQLLNTVAGQIYNLSFYVSANPDGGTYPRFGEVTYNGVPTLTAYLGAPTHGPNITWQLVSQSFTALSDSTRLAFSADPNQPNSSTGPAGEAYGLALDNVVVSAAPEPAMWALMILGFGIAGVALRRRRNADQKPGFAFA